MRRATIVLCTLRDSKASGGGASKRGDASVAMRSETRQRRASALPSPSIDSCIQKDTAPSALGADSATSCAIDAHDADRDDVAGIRDLVQSGDGPSVALHEES